MEPPIKRRLALCFVASGFSGLVLQVVWTRLAMAHFGVITPVLSVVISSFMLGLALGSWAAGRFAAHFSTAGPTYLLRTYGLIELLIGLGAVTVPYLFRAGESWLLAQGAGMDSASYLALSAGLIALSLLPWCFAMGSTFPLMMGAMRARGLAQDSFSFLYLANVIGAVLGTLVSAVVLIELTGFRGALVVAGLVNAGVCLFCLSLSATKEWAGSSVVTVTTEKRGAPLGLSQRTNLAPFILFMTGLTSMGLEVVWVRNFTPVLGTTIYAFAAIVALYLISTAAGSFAYRRDRARGKVFPLQTLLAAVLLSVTVPILLSDPRARLEFGGVLFTLVPFCGALGYLTPCLIDQDAAGNPDRAGWLYALNTIGCVLGPLAASYIFLAYNGVKLSLLFFALPYFLLFLWTSRKSFNRIERSVALSAGVCLIAALIAGKSYEERYPEGEVRRDHAATVISLGEGQGKRMLVNGIGITSLETITKIMAHMPLSFCSRQPESALVICFGMGTTYRSLLTWPVRVTAVELVPSVVKAFPYYHDNAGAVLADARGQVVVDDGRRFLQRTTDTFDVITLDPPPPFEAAGSSLLYSREFYVLAKSRLKPEGFIQQWIPAFTRTEIAAVVRSLQAEFPYIKAFRGRITGITFVASQKPFEIPSVSQMLARMPTAAEKDLVEWDPVTPAALLKEFLDREVKIEALLLPDSLLMLTDNRPYNEYHFLRRIPVRFGAKHKGET